MVELYEISPGIFINPHRVTRFIVRANGHAAQVCLADSEPPIMIEGSDAVSKALAGLRGISK